MQKAIHCSVPAHLPKVIATHQPSLALGLSWQGNRLTAVPLTLTQTSCWCAHRLHLVYCMLFTRGADNGRPRVCLERYEASTSCMRSFP
jgi:hypothetical protein